MEEENRLVSSQLDQAEETFEKSLRPRFLSQYIGQDNVKKELSVYIQAAKDRQEALDHVLLLSLIHI